MISMPRTNNPSHSPERTCVSRVPSPDVEFGRRTATMTTLIEDGSNMCWASGPVGMSDGVMEKHRKSD